MCKMRMQAISLLLAAMLPVVAQAGDILKIGVLAPLIGPRRSAGKQIMAGVKIGVESSRSHKSALKIRLKIVNIGFSGIGGLNNLMTSERVDAVIGGATPTTARNIAMDAVKWRVPTILLTNDGTLRGENTADNILQLGLPKAEVYRVNLQSWIKNNQIKRVSLLYDAGHKLTTKYGAKLTPMNFHELKHKPAIQKISLSSSQIREYYGQVRAIMSYAPMGIIVSGLPWNMANLVTVFAMQGFTTPIYLAPPADMVVQVDDLAKRGKMPIYLGTEFWPNPTNQKAQHFMKKVRRKLGWSGEKTVSTIAVKAYDAVQVIQAAWSGNPNWTKDRRPWRKITTVDGIAGNLRKFKFSKSQIMAGPMGLMVSYPDGKRNFRSTKYVPISNE